jgi:hypothetical protein
VTASATATSATFPHDRATATSPPLGIGVISPALAIAVVADPATVPPGDLVNFTVAVHNTGDVALALAVTDDTAAACDFAVTGSGLAPGTAQSQKCTVTTPSGMDSVTDTAQFTATPVGNTATGIPITGPAATEQLTGQATGTARISATAAGHGANGTGTGSGGSGGTAGGGSGGSLSGGGSAPDGGSGGGTGSGAAGGGSSGLAYTGVTVGVPLAVGFGLTAVGVVLLARRRRGGTRADPGRSASGRRSIR